MAGRAEAGAAVRESTAKEFAEEKLGEAVLRRGAEEAETEAEEE